MDIKHNMYKILKYAYLNLSPNKEQINHAAKIICKELLISAIPKKYFCNKNTSVNEAI